MDKTKPTDLDKWISVFTTISKLEKLPKEAQELLFEEMFSTTKIEDSKASKLEIVKQLKAKDFSVEQIGRLIGLMEDEIEGL